MTAGGKGRVRTEGPDLRTAAARGLQSPARRPEGSTAQGRGAWRGKWVRSHIATPHDDVDGLHPSHAVSTLGTRNQHPDSFPCVLDWPALPFIVSLNLQSRTPNLARISTDKPQRCRRPAVLRTTVRHTPPILPLDTQLTTTPQQMRSSKWPRVLQPTRSAMPTNGRSPPFPFLANLTPRH